MKFKMKLLSLLFLAVAFSACEDAVSPILETTGYMFVTSNPTGAIIYVDGTNTGKVTPDTVSAPEGLHDIKLEKDGYVTKTTQISFIANETGVLNVDLTSKGIVTLNSSPSGAEIWENGMTTNFVTPHTFSGLEDGSYTYTLKYDSYKDSSVTVTVTTGQTVEKTIELTPLYSTFGPVKLYETLNTTAAQPSGLDLSSGSAYGISSADKDLVDVYYSSDGFLVKSSALHSNMTRETFFKVGSASNLNDGIDSPVKDNSWGTSMGDRETNYVFLNDDDNHYSKIKIIGYGGGVPGEPAWIEVQWIYNQADGSVKF